MRVIKPKSIPDQYQQSLYINNSWLADDDLWLGKFSHVTQIQQGCLRVRFYPSVIQRHVESRGSRAVHTCIKRHKKVIDYWELSIDNRGAWPRDIFQSFTASCHRWKLYITKSLRLIILNQEMKWNSIDIYENGRIKERSPINRIINWISSPQCYEWVIEYL